MPGCFQYFRMFPIEWDDGEHDMEDRSALINDSAKDTEGGLSEAGPFVYPVRPRRDVGWWWGLVAAFVGVVICGFVLQFYRNPDFDALTSEKSLYNPANCPIKPAHLTPPPRRRLSASADIFGFELWLLHKTWWLLVGGVATLAAGILIGTVAVRLFESKPDATVKLIAAVQLAVPLSASVYLFVIGRPSLAVTLLVLGIVNVVCACIWLPKLPLLTRLVSVACSIISANPNLFWVSLLAQLAIWASSVPLLFTTFAAQHMGYLTHNPFALVLDGSSTCQHILTKQPVPCCTWQVSGWGTVWQIPVVLVQMWVVSFILEAQTYLISGTVCQWYFTPVSRSGSCRGNVARSGKHLKQSLGTLALGSLVLFWVRLLRIFTYVNDRPLTWKNPLSYICGVFCSLYFCVSCLITPCVDRVTKYATHRAAISGYGFSHANIVMYNTLRGSHLNHIGIGWVPPLILRFSSITLAITGGVLAIYFGNPDRTTFLTNMMTAMFKGYFVFFTILSALSLAAPLLLGVIDSLYVCFALDREQRTCTKNIVHDIFTHVPPIGPIWDDEPHAADGVVLGAPATGDSADVSRPAEYSAPPVQRV